MLSSRTAVAVGLAAQLALLGALQAAVGLSLAGWSAGVLCGVAASVGVVVLLARSGGRALGPADLVTYARATLACGAAALVADSFGRAPAVTALVSLAVVALVLDALDGWVARRTGTVSAFGARLDGEVDAFLIAVLSVYVAQRLGWWVLALGAARYVFALAAWGLPWMRAELPFRYWRKVVTAVLGIVLTAAAADVLPRVLTDAALAVAAGLLAESFGRDIWWLRRRKPAPSDRQARARVPAVALNILAALLVWFALVAPNRAYGLTPASFLRIPVEGLVIAGLALVLPSAPRRAMGVLVGVVLGLLTIVKLLDVGFFAAFDRPFDLAGDRGYLGPAVSLLGETIGGVGAGFVVTAAAVLALVIMVGMPLAVGRLSALVARHRRWSLRAVAALAVVSVVSALSGLQVGPGLPLASAGAGSLAVDHVRVAAAEARDEQKFEAENTVGEFHGRPDRQLLAGLRGKDVLVVFVESYGRVALEGLASSPHIRSVLDTETKRLDAAGYTSRSGFLTSATFGGLSWLAHGTLQSGLWVDNQKRYDRLLAGNRLTLTRAFGRAGWRTVSLMPSDSRGWPQGRSFYELDHIYGRYDLGYNGPRFGFSKMPDQFALSAFKRLELDRPGRGPLMAEIDLASSHEPWAKIPTLVPWDKLGDGSRFNSLHRVSVKKLWADSVAVKAAYARSIVYSLRTLSSFVQTSKDKNLVMVVLGDHQPMTLISGHGASRDVPVSIIAHDPTVIDRISGWGWEKGLRPDVHAPVWRMDAFRDRFFNAYSR